MGIESELFWVTLCLYDYEDDSISTQIKTEKPRAIKFKNTSLFVDDGSNLNDSAEFSKSFYVIYLDELQWTCEHHGFHATFLDFDKIILDGIYYYKLYNKRDNLKISVFYCSYARSKW